VPAAVGATLALTDSAWRDAGKGTRPPADVPVPVRLEQLAGTHRRAARRRHWYEAGRPAISPSTARWSSNSAGRPSRLPGRSEVRCHRRRTCRSPCPRHAPSRPRLPQPEIGPIRLRCRSCGPPAAARPWSHSAYLPVPRRLHPDDARHRGPARVVRQNRALSAQPLRRPYEGGAGVSAPARSAPRTRPAGRAPAGGARTTSRADEESSPQERCGPHGPVGSWDHSSATSRPKSLAMTFPGGIL
jgi:hypothetical protein